VSTVNYPYELIDDGTGNNFHAQLATCECSNIDPEIDEGYANDTFYVFWDSRFNPPHLHIQCYDCEQTYCPYQLCIPPPTVVEGFGQ
jgi:hypothetical protein